METARITLSLEDLQRKEREISALKSRLQIAIRGKNSREEKTWVLEKKLDEVSEELVLAKDAQNRAEGLVKNLEISLSEFGTSKGQLRSLEYENLALKRKLEEMERYVNRNKVSREQEVEKYEKTIAKQVERIKNLREEVLYAEQKAAKAEFQLQVNIDMKREAETAEKLMSEKLKRSNEEKESSLRKVQSVEGKIKKMEEKLTIALDNAAKYEKEAKREKQRSSDLRINELEASVSHYKSQAEKLSNQVKISEQEKINIQMEAEKCIVQKEWEVWGAKEGFKRVYLFFFFFFFFFLSCVNGIYEFFFFSLSLHYPSIALHCIALRRRWKQISMMAIMVQCLRLRLGGKTLAR